MGSEGPALSQIQALYEGGSVAGLTDAELVERFTNANDGGERAALAFSALVQRHGPMVMRVCRATLRNQHDAEDAFQAVFLVLFRQAGTLWVRDSLGPWLHTIAVRTAAYARRQSQRRQLHEHRRGPPAPEKAEVDADLVAAVHEEVGRLPDRFRQAVVLCDLEGLSHEVAAARLGWPVGTVKSRQARGRERLRGRLQRRGLAPADTPLATAMAPLPVAPSLVSATARAAALFKAGQAATAGTVPAAAEALARGILRTISMNRMRLWILSTLAAGTIATGTVAFAARMFATDGAAPGEPPASDTPSAPRPPAGSLLELRIAADRTHDADAEGKPGYRWVRVATAGLRPPEDLLTRVDPKQGQMLLIKLDPQNLTERDLSEAKAAQNEPGRPAIEFRLTQDGATRLGALTKAHLPREPEAGAASRYHMAVIIEGRVVSLPIILAEIRGAAILELGDRVQPKEVDRVLKLLAGAAASNADKP